MLERMSYSFYLSLASLVTLIRSCFKEQDAFTEIHKIHQLRIQTKKIPDLYEVWILFNNSSAKHYVVLIKDDRLAWGDRALGFSESDFE